MNPVRLAFRVLRVDRRTRTSTILTAVGVAIATGLVLLLVSLPFATKARAERSNWQQLEPSSHGASTMLVRMGTDYTGGKEITRLDVSSTVDTVALPPGVPSFPKPGEVLVSPALFERMHALPASQLADRFPGKVVGTLDDRALKYPDQLVALVGHTPETMPDNATPVSGFGTADRAEVDPLLALLAGVGVVVLVVPSLVLVASSSRLTAARRERRLAALRLAGATPGQVTGIVAAETGVAAVAGAVLGLAVSPLLHWLATFVSWGGGTWLPTDFRLPVWLTALLVVAMPVLVLLAAVLGLRRVVRDPIGAASAHTPKPLHAWRLLALPVAGGFFFYVVSDKSGSNVGTVLLGLLMVIGAAVVVGPWITFAVGRIFVERWRKPAGLLAGRRLLDDPRGAYRASAGVVLAVFIGSMALTLMPSFEGLAGGGGTYRDSVLTVNTSTERAHEIAAQTNERLARYGQQARATELYSVMLSSVNGSQVNAYVVPCERAVELFRVDLACAAGPAVYGPGDLSGYRVSSGFEKAAVPLAPGIPTRPFRPLDSDVSVQAVVDLAAVPPGIEPKYVNVAVSTAGSDPEVVRTALAASGEGVYSRDVYLTRQLTQLADLRRVTVIGLVAAAVLAGCSAAIATAGSVLDRRRTFGALMAAGTPVRVLSRALRAEAALPALAATIGAGVAGMLVGLGLFSMVKTSGEAASAVLTPWLLAPVVLGLGVAVLAASVCTPALNRVRAEPLADE
ncbi:FtsX-like permease family protein [Amycolatopsis sp. GM8]|uniref:FtsX-like permease family protein n=1 Tax=Amycolatopsis sp. GM8 TaxID=2896530 RepID=UPI001F441C11|nr:FtsX-like permease family protein [Amycolatopsis sp. GM8]